MNPAGKVRCNMSNRQSRATVGATGQRGHALVSWSSAPVSTRMQMTSPGPPAINSPSAGRGAYAICALPDLCLRERGLLVRRDGDALGGSLDQLGHVLVVILANNMTAR